MSRRRPTPRKPKTPQHVWKARAKAKAIRERAGAVDQAQAAADYADRERAAEHAAEHAAWMAEETTQ